MPIHLDWRELYHSFIEQYGEEKGKSVFYAYCEKHNINYTKAKPKKENFSWIGDIKPVPGATNLIRGEALHPLKTVHPEEWPSVRVYLEEELQKAAHTLANKPLLLDHSMLIDGEVTGAQYEDGAIEYVAQVNDSRILGLIKDGAIKHCSVEFEWKSLEHVNGVAPKGINFTGLSLLKNFAPGDPLSMVELFEVWEGIVKKLKEAKMKEQAEPQEFILYMLHDPMAFLPEHFSTAWIDQTNGIQGIFGRLRKDPENSVPQALLFMKATGWTLEKMQDWLQNHPQYLRASAPAQPGIQPASGDTGVMKMSKGKLKPKLKTLEGRVTFLETVQRLKEQDAELTVEEIKQKIIDLTKQQEELRSKLYPESPLSEEEKTAVQTQIDVLYAEIQAYEQALATKIAGQVTPTPATAEQPEGGTAQEAEWDTEYVNNLPDSAFAYIEPGGEKDEQGKITPRSLRHFEYKNMQGNLDRKHIVNGLARLGQKLGDWATAEAKAQIKKKLCSAVNAWNREHEDKIESDVCGTAEEATKEQGEQGPEKDEHGCIIGKERYDEEQDKCVPIETATEQQGEEQPKAGEPKTDRQRFMDHYGLTEEQMTSVLEWIGEDIYRLLPEPGTKRQQQAEESRKKGLGEAIIAPGTSEPQPSDLISKQQVLALIPNKRVWASWSYGPQMLVKQLKHKLEKEDEA